MCKTLSSGGNLPKSELRMFEQEPARWLGPSGVVLHALLSPANCDPLLDYHHCIRADKWLRCFIFSSMQRLVVHSSGVAS